MHAPVQSVNKSAPRYHGCNNGSFTLKQDSFRSGVPVTAESTIKAENRGELGRSGVPITVRRQGLKCIIVQRLSPPLAHIMHRK
ncbi:hypothetical protein NDU88_003034 [Pleurodeles waltl]|uniref:Uncharacterized protein n=1 Tax=Pleurodeles waltl TaxID=8319 RepID=A0AAV7WRM7_PLEWA|nr:hypothetical protein NDU88_003034 [Pleurodeles waltl]